VEVAHALPLEVDRLDGDRALFVLLQVAAPGCVRQVVRVDLDDHRSPELQLDRDVLGQRPVDDELLHLQPVESREILERRLEERPLVALEVDCDAVREHRERLEAVSMEQLDPEIRVAVRLRELAVGEMERMRSVGGGLESELEGHVSLRPAAAARAPRLATRSSRARGSRTARA
jgi:hypothetical protein